MTMYEAATEVVQTWRRADATATAQSEEALDKAIKQLAESVGMKEMNVEKGDLKEAPKPEDESNSERYYDDDIFREDCERGEDETPEPIAVDEDIQKLIGWRDGLCDDWGPGLYKTICRKLHHEQMMLDKEWGKTRLSDDQILVLKKFMAMDEETQLRCCYTVLGE
jgi:hypothetical protein